MSEISPPPLLSIDARTVLTPAEQFQPGRVVVRNGVVEAVGLVSDIRIPAGALRLDASQYTLTPGFVDPHVHGYGGFDVMTADPAGFDAIRRGLARHGTTTFLPTTVSSPPQVLSDAIDRLTQTAGVAGAGAKPIGIHLEGPFINTAKRGTHRDDYVLAPDVALLSEWIRRGRGRIRLVTVAPELAGADSLVAAALKAGVTVAMGHSDASIELAANAIDRGIRYAVHTFNAMRPWSHRDPGIAGAVLADDRVFAEIIADGVHVAPEAVKVFARAKGRDRILLATDATSATGMPDGTYSLGHETVWVVRGVCRDAEDRLAGSTLTQDAALRNLVRWTGMKPEDALFSVTLNPAQALGLSCGRIEPGAPADLVVMDDDFNVMRTLVDGRTAFERKNGQT